MDSKQLRALGNSEYAKGNFEAAKKLYTQSIDSIPEATRAKEMQKERMLALSNRCQVHLKLGCFQEALQDADEALKLNELDEKLIFRKTTALYKLGHSKQAVECLSELVGSKLDTSSNLDVIQKDAVAQFGKFWRVETQELKRDFLKPAEYAISKLVKRNSLGSGLCGRPLVAPICATCNNQASPDFVCKGCFLVSYCSKTCQRNHECGKTGKVLQGDGLGGLSGVFLWGNVPAISLLGPGQALPEKELKLCFVGSGNLRDMLTTLSRLPGDYPGRVSIVLDDRNCQVVLRNFMMLELLRVYGRDAVDLVISLWYSAAMTEEQAKTCEKAGWDILKRCGYFDRTAATATCSRSLSAMTGPPLVAAFEGGLSTISADINDRNWQMLQGYLESGDLVPKDVVAEQLKRLVTSSKFVPGYLRASWYQFRSSGMLLPFSTSQKFSRDHFSAANRYLLDPETGWQEQGVSDPLYGWSNQDLQAALRESGTPSKDLYGGLFFHLRKLLLKFIDVVEVTRVNIRLFDKDARLLASNLILNKQSFHAISTSNIADGNHVGMSSVLNDWGPLLETNGTLVTMQMQWFTTNYVHPIPNLKKILGLNNAAASRKVTGALKKRAKEIGLGGLTVNNTEAANLVAWCSPTDEAYAKYLRDQDMYKVAAKIGLKARDKHQCVPVRLCVPLDAPCAAAPVDYFTSVDELEFDMFRKNQFLERYMEWTK